MVRRNRSRYNNNEIKTISSNEFDETNEKKKTVQNNYNNGFSNRNICYLSHKIIAFGILKIDF